MLVKRLLDLSLSLPGRHGSEETAEHITDAGCKSSLLNFMLCLLKLAVYFCDRIGKLGEVTVQLGHLPLASLDHAE